jgi:hypothetical protein
MKGEFFVDYPTKIDEDGSLRYKLMYQKSEKAIPQVAKEQNISTRGKEAYLDRIIATSAVSMYHKAVAACVGLSKINGILYFLKHLFSPYNYESLLEEAVKIGEPLVEDKESKIFSNGLARARTEMGELSTNITNYLNSEKQRFIETAEISLPVKKRLEDTQEIDFNNPEETKRASKRLFGDSFE